MMKGTLLVAILIAGACGNEAKPKPKRTEDELTVEIQLALNRNATVATASMYLDAGTLKVSTDFDPITKPVRPLEKCSVSLLKTIAGIPEIADLLREGNVHEAACDDEKEKGIKISRTW